ncbi:MAG: NAD(P)-dependent glycerol-3-phosphate dehydrogenase [Candidatus Omnitrophica bacterium]|jgi:glycerol-3-phosphate dehydrogenase (NAD(P)+)|nr:NAD(P)-dependent glycerol-3-phosphate dehydrogenase [Candidatus Omnitrophota bacterium]MDD3274911.1 NAD(P)-dependent glycerol-3-phosphate dehydrogenase [Candidatus Omnitrophota bacterium]MDD5725635.1 NAD(P)-dependent glycerol-3-phosphate dehydrogenase [Candidatus Omnitrophota bacterium]
MTPKLRIGVLGDGGWGTTLAVLLSQKGYPVTLWGAFADYVKTIKKTRRNPRFLPGVKIPPAVEITSEISQAVSDKEIVVLAAPSQFTRAVLKKITGGFDKKTIFLSVTKGIEIASSQRISEIIHAELGNVKLAVLSGPTIAGEVAKGIPTTAVVASKDRKVRKIIQDVFSTKRFRVYTNPDITGVELGGSLKNVIAIACGISDGLGFGTNTKAAILTRGLAEISRLGIAMGARVKTFSGISGLGDLVTTCINKNSRNRSLGEMIGKGKNLKDICGRMKMVAEGIPTAKSAYALSLKYKVDMPITREIYRLIYHGKPPLKAVNDLMSRKSKEE